ncbi:hypothetical protein Taro_056480, partial [Colocasia esculenta]|nr:hypothetical protein [Colocasia esculenta]
VWICGFGFEFRPSLMAWGRDKGFTFRFVLELRLGLFSDLDMDIFSFGFDFDFDFGFGFGFGFDFGFGFGFGFDLAYLGGLWLRYGISGFSEVVAAAFALYHALSCDDDYLPTNADDLEMLLLLEPPLTVELLTLLELADFEGRQ